MRQVGATLRPSAQSETPWLKKAIRVDKIDPRSVSKQFTALIKVAGEKDGANRP
jgi:hypothetical protein